MSSSRVPPPSRHNLVRCLSHFQTSYSARGYRMGILESTYIFSCMLHGASTSSGGLSSDAFYRSLVPEIGSPAHRVYKAVSEEQAGRGPPCWRDRSWLVKVAKGAVPTGQTVVRRAQDLCECALNIGSPLNGQR